MIESVQMKGASVHLFHTSADANFVVPHGSRKRWVRRHLCLKMAVSRQLPSCLVCLIGHCKPVQFGVDTTIQIRATPMYRNSTGPNLIVVGAADMWNFWQIVRPL